MNASNNKQREIIMKKMNEKAMKAANGGWGTWCPVCKKSKLFKWYQKKAAKMWVVDHNFWNTGHNAYFIG